MPTHFCNPVKNIRPLQSLLDWITRHKYTVKSNRREQVKSQPLVNAKRLERKGTEFHKYQERRTKISKLSQVHPSLDRSRGNLFRTRITRPQSSANKQMLKVLTRTFFSCVRHWTRAHAKQMTRSNNKFLSVVVTSEPPPKRRPAPCRSASN